MKKSCFIISLDLKASKEDPILVPTLDTALKILQFRSPEKFLTEPEIIKGDESQFILEGDIDFLFLAIRHLLLLLGTKIRVSVVFTKLDINFLNTTFLSYKMNHEAFYIASDLLGESKKIKKWSKEQTKNDIKFYFIDEEAKYNNFDKDSKFDIISEIFTSFYNLHIILMKKWDIADYTICNYYIKGYSNQQICEEIKKIYTFLPNFVDSYSNPTYISRILSTKHIRQVAENEKKMKELLVQFNIIEGEE